MGEYKKEMSVFDSMKQRDKDLYVIDREKYLYDLEQPYELYNMDDINRHIGTTLKFWWEKHIGHFYNKMILDVGGGNSYHTPYWLSKGNTVCLTDISPETLNINKRTLGILGFAGDLVQNNAENLCFKDNTFDAINMNLFLHHVSSIPKVLKSAHRVLKDDGYLLIVEPNHFFPFRYMYECSFMRDYNPINNFLWRTRRTGKDDKGVRYSSLIKDVKEAGFNIQVIEYDKNFLGYPFGYFFPKFKKAIKLIFYLDRGIVPLLPKSWTNFIYIIARKNTAERKDGRSS